MGVMRLPAARVMGGARGAVDGGREGGAEVVELAAGGGGGAARAIMDRVTILNADVAAFWRMGGRMEGMMGLGGLGIGGGGGPGGVVWRMAGGFGMFVGGA